MYFNLITSNCSVQAPWCHIKAESWSQSFPPLFSSLLSFYDYLIRNIFSMFSEGKISANNGSLSESDNIYSWHRCSWCKCGTKLTIIFYISVAIFLSTVQLMFPKNTHTYIRLIKLHNEERYTCFLGFFGNYIGPVPYPETLVQPPESLNTWFWAQRSTFIDRLLGKIKTSQQIDSYMSKTRKNFAWATSHTRVDDMLCLILLLSPNSAWYLIKSFCYKQ